MTSMIKDLEGEILDQIIQEGKDPVDISIKEQIAEWKSLQKDAVVIAKMAKAITTRISELEGSFEEIIKEVEGNKIVVDGVILEYVKKKSNTTVKYKEVVDYALKMVNDAQKQVIQKFIASVTVESKLTDVLAVTDPELEQFILDLKPIAGEELSDKITSMARTGFSNLVKLIKNMKKRALKEGVASNVDKLVKNLVATFKTKFKKLFGALDKQKKATEALVKAVKNVDLKESEEVGKFKKNQQVKYKENNTWRVVNCTDDGMCVIEDDFGNKKTVSNFELNPLKESEEVVEEAKGPTAADRAKLEKLKKEFRDLGDQIDERALNGEIVQLTDPIMKKAVRVRDQLGALNKKLGILRPGNVK